MMFPEVGPCVERILDLLQLRASTLRAVASLLIRLAGQMFA